MSSHLSRWYASGGVAGMVTIIAIALVAFYFALAGHQLFSPAALDE
jgi:hypothetical protein